MDWSIYMSMGVALIIFGIAAAALGNIYLRVWLHNGDRNGGKKK